MSSMSLMRVPGSACKSRRILCNPSTQSRLWRLFQQIIKPSHCCPFHYSILFTGRCKDREKTQNLNLNWVSTVEHNCLRQCFLTRMNVICTSGGACVYSCDALIPRCILDCSSPRKTIHLGARFCHLALPHFSIGLASRLTTHPPWSYNFDPYVVSGRHYRARFRPLLCMCSSILYFFLFSFLIWSLRTKVCQTCHSSGGRRTVDTAYGRNSCSSRHWYFLRLFWLDLLQFLHLALSSFRTISLLKSHSRQYMSFSGFLIPLFARPFHIFSSMTHSKTLKIGLISWPAWHWSMHCLEELVPQNSELNFTGFFIW